MNWIKLLDEVSTVEALLVLVNDYLLQFPDTYWSWIPRSARPGLVARAEDIHGWHRRLVEALEESRAPNIRLQDLGVFFLRASARAHELEGSGQRPSNDRNYTGTANGQD